MSDRATGTAGRCLWFVIALCISTASAAAEESSSRDLKQLSMEELMDLEVTSVSRRPEKWLEAPAAIQVITGEDIRRSGAADIPSALRLANSLSVAQENAHEWVISARGFSSDVGNKLLVLFDGRTVYTPLFSGVFWDRQDYVLEDIDRIEVISGPGGALWGANAVNGVINITTKKSSDTQGLYLEAGGGTQLRSFSGLRYGGELASGTTYRLYGKYFDRDSEMFASGLDAGDAWHMGQAGFRIDSQRSDHEALTLQGDLYKSESGLTSGGESEVTGGNVLGRWSRTVSEHSDLSLQFYYDRTHLILPVPGAVFAPAGTLKDDLDTFDLDFQHRLPMGGNHHLMWGLGFRLMKDALNNAPALSFFPARQNQRLYSGFIQDEIALTPALKLTVGTKIEHTHYTGLEVEPSARLQWKAGERQLLWGAVSRAVRTPSRIDRDISNPAPGYLIVVLQGGPQFDSERLLAYELGYRAQLGSRVTAALSTFYNQYDDLRSTSASPPDPVFLLPFPFFFDNNLEGDTYGFELSATFQVRDNWRVDAGYNLLKADLRVQPGRFDFNNALNETADPEQQASLRSALDLPGNLELDATLRWVDRRTINREGNPETVPDYAELDLRLGWKPTPAVELSLVGRNLLDRYHPEFGIPGSTRVEVRRSAYARLAWRF